LRESRSSGKFAKGIQEEEEALKKKITNSNSNRHPGRGGGLAKKNN